MTWQFWVFLFFASIGLLLIVVMAIDKMSSTTNETVSVDGEQGGEREAEILNNLRVSVATASAPTASETAVLVQRLRTVILCPADNWADKRPLFIKGMTAAQTLDRRKAQINAKLSLYKAMETYCGQRTEDGRTNSRGLCAVAMNDTFQSIVLKFGTQQRPETGQIVLPGQQTQYAWNLQLNQGEVLLMHNAAMTTDGVKLNSGILGRAALDKNTPVPTAEIIASTRMVTRCNFTGVGFSLLMDIDRSPKVQQRSQRKVTKV